ncbi:MAG: hypothetical protein ACOC2F_08490 [Bacteroidota bacterium]
MFKDSRHKFLYEYDSESKIMTKRYQGFIDIEDIEKSWDAGFNNGILKYDIKGFILDYRRANFDIKAHEYKKILNFYKQHHDFFARFKFAIITNNPTDITIPILVESDEEGYNTRPFTTIEAAVEWVSV